MCICFTISKAFLSCAVIRRKYTIKQFLRCILSFYSCSSYSPVLVLMHFQRASHRTLMLVGFYLFLNGYYNGFFLGSCPPILMCAPYCPPPVLTVQAIEACAKNPNCCLRDSQCNSDEKCCQYGCSCNWRCTKAQEMTK